MKNQTSICEVGEDLVNRYVDAVLPSGEEPALFSHLADCESCRRLLDSVLLFRRQSRMERLVVPPEVDAGLMLLLERKRKESLVEAEHHERSPVWKRNFNLSRGTAAVLAFLLVAVGFTLPRVPADNQLVPLVIGHQEYVSLLGSRSEPVYVFYPGVTVEGERE